jgi:3-oxoacyl-[acyl-carrier-protein] synthase III
MTSGLLLEQELKKKNSKDADKGTSYLAIKAAQDLLAKGNVDPLDIDLIIWEQQHQICQLLRLEFMWLLK